VTRAFSAQWSGPGVWNHQWNVPPGRLTQAAAVGVQRRRRQLQEYNDTDCSCRGSASSDRVTSLTTQSVGSASGHGCGRANIVEVVCSWAVADPLETRRDLAQTRDTPQDSVPPSIILDGGSRREPLASQASGTATPWCKSPVCGTFRNDHG
jgi:hypothetical protein